MSACACLRIKKKWKGKDETIFMKNGGMLLEKLIASCDGKCNPIRSFSAEELKRATNNYDAHYVLTIDSGYKLYKGLLEDIPISIKKFKDDTEGREFAFTEIIFASRTSAHKNVLKFSGCCLETEVPILVFESFDNGTVADCMYGPNRAQFQPLLWKHRLKIAVDTAHVVTYLHTAFPRPIIHRHIKPSTILLNEHYVPKLSDFALSVSIPEGESHVHDVMIGTMGHMAPEYMTTGYFNEKQDVFSFGACLLVLLTGQRVVDFSRPRNEEFLVDYVKGCNETNRFNEIVDPLIGGEGPWPGKEQQLQAFSALAFRCMSKSAEDRPTMIDVAKQLRQMYLSAVTLC